jgi:hypothetical protein
MDRMDEVYWVSSATRDSSSIENEVVTDPDSFVAASSYERTDASEGYTGVFEGSYTGGEGIRG